MHAPRLPPLGLRRSAVQVLRPAGGVPQDEPMLEVNAPPRHGREDARMVSEEAKHGAARPGARLLLLEAVVQDQDAVAVDEVRPLLVALHISLREWKKNNPATANGSRATTGMEGGLGPPSFIYCSKSSTIQVIKSRREKKSSATVRQPGSRLDSRRSSIYPLSVGNTQPLQFNC